MRPPLLDLLSAYQSGRTDFPLAHLSTGRVEWALECGLAPVLARCCADDPDAPSSPLWTTIVGSDLAARVVTEDQATATVELIDACRPRVGRLTLLKGVWLSHDLHVEPHLRPMRDVDVLVEPEAAREVERVLIELGYQATLPEHEFRHHNHLVPYRHPTMDVLVEVHHALVPKEGPKGSDPLAIATVRDHLRPATFRGRPIFRLSDELQIAYLAAHWARSMDVVGGGGSLVIMLDMPVLARRVEWRLVVDLLASPASASATLLILSYLRTRGLIDLEPWVLPAIWERQRAFGRWNLQFLQALTDRWLVDGRPYGRVFMTSRNFDTIWMGLLNPRSALVNVLSLPWALLPLGFRAAATPYARPLARAVGVELRDLDRRA
jgi:hypothetical protein